jgi:hypothetical protein
MDGSFRAIQQSRRRVRFRKRPAMRPAAAAIEPSTTLWTNHSAITIMARSPVTFLGQCDSTISWVNEWLNGNTRNGITRPTMRFVAIKTEEQQATLMLDKTRDLLVRQRTMLINALRGHLTEYGIVSAQGAGGVRLAIEALHEGSGELAYVCMVRLAWAGKPAAQHRGRDREDRSRPRRPSRNASNQRLSLIPTHNARSPQCATLVLFGSPIRRNTASCAARRLVVQGSGGGRRRQGRQRLLL